MRVPTSKSRQFPILFALTVLLSVTSCKAKHNLATSATKWVEYENNPVLRYSKDDSGILLNDPSVLKDGSGFRMWATGGQPFEKPLLVQAYEARSKDGITWTTNFEPILGPGEPGSWDDSRIETVTVVKAGKTYHLYYAGCESPCDSGRFGIGHAVSTDGTHWEKDPANPVIEPHENAQEYGFYTTAEPAAVHHDGKIYLYYASAKSNHPNYGSPFGIMLATSDDGSRFEKHGAVYTMTDSYDIKSFRGYSTPTVHVADGLFHLYHNVVHTPKKPSDFSQVAISYATSKDGFSFSEAETNIFVVDNKGWKQSNLHGPTVLKDGDTTKMWFAAKRKKPKFAFGIGYATKQDK